MSKTDSIIVLDFGSQYSHLIGRRIRELNVYSEVMPHDTQIKNLKSAKGIIFSGGPNSVISKSAPKVSRSIFKLGVPILGICYGHQLMAYLLGGKIKESKEREYGFASINIKKKGKLFKGLGNKETVWMSHGDSVETLPRGFKTLAETDTCPITAMGDERRGFYGLQFHPEVTDTPKGKEILKNFTYNACGCKPSWQVSDYADKISNDIKEKVGDKKVFVFVSGGVDSMVAFTLFNKVLGEDQVYGFHVDNGFMRKNESGEIEKTLIKTLGYDNFHIIRASGRFLKALRSIVDPERKRKIIGKVFVDVLNAEVKKIHLDSQEWILGQGTIYPDTIESGGTKQSARIKTHHNQVDEIQQMIKEGRVIEPLRELYKDEVRELGITLGLPVSMVWRHPFPGPGLAIQTLCSKGGDKVRNAKSVDMKVRKILQEHNADDLNYNILAVRSVGVQGDFRTYAHPVALSLPKIKAGWLDKNWTKLGKLATNLANNLKEINRVVFLLNDCNLSKCTIKKAFLIKGRLDLLREIHVIVTKHLEKNKLMRQIWEMPVILLPFGERGKESVVLRPLHSENAMTIQFAKIPERVLRAINKDILKLGKISAVFFDITNKPPGMVQWE